MKVVSLISGGIDSPVSTYFMLRSGAEVVAIHLDNRPFTDDRQVKKALELVKHLENVFEIEIKTYVVPHAKNQASFARNCKRKLGCVLCKRMMLRIAEEIAKREDADAIVTGDSLGQVASQTLQNLSVETQTVSIPILRPLIGFDKNNIIEVARDIGTYEISILPGLCCTIVPKKPATQAKLEVILQEEEKADVASLLKESINGAK
ncbi:MAG: hypothetical protein SVM80_01310 [Halobacteriota archaeon]|nr:hypothetical protein [Halobacteriota archaeon]